MAGPDRIHLISRRGAFEHYRETACPDCEAVIFIPEDESSPHRYDDLTIFQTHACKALFPVEVGPLSRETASGFRGMVEAAFGKPLRRFTGTLKGKGLPVHFTADWQPELGHVPVFSKSDVHRPLDPADGLMQLAIPVIRKHFGREAKTSIRKYFFNAAGVVKRERIGSKDVIRPVIRWRWPPRTA